MNALIVEVDQVLRDYLRVQVAEATRPEGAGIFEAATLADALAIVRSEQIDTVLSDGCFPPGWRKGMNDLSRWADAPSGMQMLVPVKECIICAGMMCSSPMGGEVVRLYNSFYIP